MKTYNIVLVGCGYIGEQHLQDIYYRENVNLLAVVDTDIEKARLFAKKFGANHYGTDYKEFVSLKETDIVIISTNVNSHFEIAEFALKNNKHVLCEKPIASSLEEGKRFYELVKGSDSKVLIAHILRHNKSYQKIAQMIKDGVIGELKMIRVVQNHHAKEWGRYKRLLNDCSPAVDCGVHYFDVMQWISGSPIVSVMGVDTKLEEDCLHNNYDVAIVKMANGCTGFYEGGWSQNLSFKNDKEFIGTKGHIKLTLKNDRAENQEEGDLISLYSSQTGEYTTINLQSKYKDMYAQLTSLIDMIEKDAPPVITMEEVLSSFNVAKTAEMAMKNKTVLKVESIV